MTDAHRTVGEWFAEAGLAEDRFVTVKDGAKMCVDHDSRWSDPAAVPGANYGVYADEDDQLFVLDVDVHENDEDSDTVAVAALSGLERGLRFKSPHVSEESPGGHRLYELKGDRTPAELFNDAFGKANPVASWGEVIAKNKYIVGAGSQLEECSKEWCDTCATPAGGRYEVEADAPIPAVDPDAVVEALAADPDLTRTDRDTELSDHEEGGSASASQGANSDSEEFDELSREQVEALLEEIPGDQNFPEWIRTGYAVLAWDSGEEGKEVFEEWSRENEDWEDPESSRQVDYIWNQGDPSSGGKDRAGVGTLIHIARQHGDPDVFDGATREAKSLDELIAEHSDEYDDPEEVPDDPFADDEPVSAGASLSPDSIFIHAGLDAEAGEEIGDLTDREKAAAVWETVKQNADVHVRVRRDNDSLWCYDEGVWVDNGGRALRHAARKCLGGANYGANVLAETKAQARADPVAEVDPAQFGLDPGLLAVKNGLLDLDAAADGAGDDAVRELNPENFALTRLPVEYDPTAGYDRWQSLVEEWAERGKADALQEYVGYCLHIGAMPIHRALLLVGSGSNGKGTFLHVVRALLGEDNTSSVELQTLANEKDAVADFYGSIANIDDDLSARNLGSGLGMFKKLVAGDRVRGRALYEDGFEFQATGKHLYAANEVPKVNVPDEDEAFWRRWLLVEFPNHYPPSQRDGTLRDELSEPDMLSGVLNWAIEGRHRLLEQGYFTDEDRLAAQKRSRWQSWGSSADKFIEECLERDESAPNVSTSQVHRRYVAWCREHEHDPIGQQSLTTKLKCEDLDYGKKRVDGTSTNAFGAMAFGEAVPDLDDAPEQQTTL